MSDSEIPTTNDKTTDDLLREGSSEPLVTTSTVSAVATAIFAVLVSFAFPITDTQQTAILGLIAVMAPFIVLLFSRRRVFSPRTVARLLIEQSQRDRAY